MPLSRVISDVTAIRSVPAEAKAVHQARFALLNRTCDILSEVKGERKLISPDKF